MLRYTEASADALESSACWSRRVMELPISLHLTSSQQAKVERRTAEVLTELEEMPLWDWNQYLDHNNRSAAYAGQLWLCFLSIRTQGCPRF